MDLSDEFTVRIKISDATKSRWEVPNWIISRPDFDTKSHSVISTHYSFTYTKNPFTFSVTRLSDGTVVYESIKELVFKDQYIQIGSVTSRDAFTFGLGESARLDHALKPGSTRSLWAVDMPSMFFYSNLYGVYPYYMQMLHGMAHGVMLLNSNGMNVEISEKNDRIVFKTIGGIIDLYVFTGPAPADVLSQYLTVVGKPTMMPYWSLGFHSSKYGYTSIYEVEQVVANYSAAGIPLETQWVDIDYMEEYRDFTTDPVSFPVNEMKKFLNYLHSQNQHMVPIIDPGIMVKSGYPAYEDGIKHDIFIKDIKGGNYLGQVWPGPTLFPDFFHPNAQEYWTAQLRAFYDEGIILSFLIL